jgi:hypothetical protein
VNPRPDQTRLCIHRAPNFRGYRVRLDLAADPFLPTAGTDPSSQTACETRTKFSLNQHNGITLMGLIPGWIRFCQSPNAYITSSNTVGEQSNHSASILSASASFLAWTRIVPLSNLTTYVFICSFYRTLGLFTIASPHSRLAFIVRIRRLEEVIPTPKKACLDLAFCCCLRTARLVSEPRPQKLRPSQQ